MGEQAKVGISRLRETIDAMDVRSALDDLVLSRPDLAAVADELELDGPYRLQQALAALVFEKAAASTGSRMLWLWFAVPVVVKGVVWGDLKLWKEFAQPGAEYTGLGDGYGAAYDYYTTGIAD